MKQTKRIATGLTLLLMGLVLLFALSVFAGAEPLTFHITKENDDWEEEDCLVTVEPIPDQLFDEAGAEPSLTLTVDGAALQLGEDYDVFYRNQYEAGTAYACVRFYWPYSGSFEVPFTIYRIDANAAAVDPIPAQEYTGWTLEPEPTVRYGGEVLRAWEDYDLEWSDNILPGTGKITIRFRGKYTGTKTVTFSIAAPGVKNLKAAADGTSVNLSWDGNWEAYAYQVQRYDAAKKKYVKIKTVTAPYYTDVKTEELTTYRYRVILIMREGTQTWKGKAVTVSVTTGLNPIKVSLTTMKNKIKLTWKPSAKADGYLIYRTEWVDEWNTLPAKKLVKLKDGAAKAYVDKKADSAKAYSYTVRSYKKLNGTTVFSAPEWVYSRSVNAVLAGVKKTPQRSYPLYNAQGDELTLMYQINLSDRDIRILDKFAQKHFKDGWTDEQKLQYTLTWINQKVTYARGDLWYKIEDKSYVDAIFVYKLGQCVQYNGAMAAMMVHLGVPARLIMGYRGTWPDSIWQHFWVESPINGNIYVVECGNAGNSGGWSYFFEPYANTFGYIKNKQNVS